MLRDFRYAFRLIARSPGFTAVAVLTLASGIALNSAIFGIFNALLFKSLPVHDPSRLVWIGSSSVKPDGPQGNLTYPDFEAIRERRDIFADVFAFTETSMSVSAGGQALRVDGHVVSENMFDVLGLRMAIGRGFTADDSGVGGTQQVAVIAHSLWQRLFGSDAAAAGKSVVINGHVFTVIGVAPRGFIGPDLMAHASVWVPLTTHRAALPDVRAPFSPDSWWLKAIGRLAPGATIGEAQAALTAFAQASAQANPTTRDGVMLNVTAFRGTDPRDRQQIVPLAASLLGLTIAVLLIACANIAGLLLARAAGRQGEIGIRLAIGATRMSLIRQLLAESLVLALLAGGCGLLLGMWGTELLVRMIDIPVGVDSGPDWRVTLFTFTIALFAGMAFGVTPALRAASQNVQTALRGDRHGQSASRPSRLQRSLVVGQLAVALVLLVGAGVFLRGLAAAWNSHVGFEYTDRVAVSFDLRLQQYTSARASAFYAQLLDRVRAVPGVQDATLAQPIPLGGRVFVYGTWIAPAPAGANTATSERASVHQIWINYFSTLGIPLVRGRDFALPDLKGTPDVAIVSETTARKYWPGADPIGQRLSLTKPEGPYLTVVGVVRDVLIDEFTERPWPTVYLPHEREPAEVAVLAWSARSAAETVREIQQAVRALDPDLPVIAARPLSSYVADRLDGERALSSLLAVCGTLALVLAALGLYGIMGYAVARRTREIGVRIALGAAQRDVLIMFVAEGLRVAAWGLTWGFIPALAATHVLSSELIGVGFADVPTMVTAVAVLTAATVLAVYAPARRAMRLDPVAALRAE